MENKNIDQVLAELRDSITEKLMTLNLFAETHGEDCPNEGHVADMMRANCELREVLAHFND